MKFTLKFDRQIWSGGDVITVTKNMIYAPIKKGPPRCCDTATPVTNWQVSWGRKSSR